ncbi:MAG: TatD family hydrolase [Candidatus Aenigmatarchaeota archaeon]
MIIVDSHVHLYEFSDSEIKSILKNNKIVLISVAEDFITSLKNIKLSIIYENVIPAIGIHPWKAGETKKEDLEAFKNLFNRENIRIIGEIGLDKNFYPNTIEKQKEIFEFFLNYAKEYQIPVNLHSSGAWKEVFDYVLKYDIKKAYFHWYTGPKELMEEIVKIGYFIGINVAAIIQEKQKEIIKNVKIENLLTESDGLYRYKSLILHPNKLLELYNYVSNLKNIKITDLSNQIRNNLSRYIY